MATALSIQRAPGVHQIRLGCSNAYVLTGSSGGFVLVDTGTPWDARRLARALARLGGLRRCEMILLTHAHPDHAGSAAFVAQASGAPIAAHEAERPFLEARQLYGIGPVQRVAFGLGALIWPVRPCCLSRALEDGERIETPAGEWRVVHTPGHARGHLAYWRERDGVLLSGDAVLNVLPWTRRPGLTLPLRLFTEDARQALESARRLAELRPRVLLPGHGEPLLDAAEPLQRFAFG